MSALLTIIAVSALLHVIHGADPIPIQHRIAYSPTGMTVSWYELHKCFCDVRLADKV